MKTVLELEDLANKAVKAALNQKWQEAIDINQEILDEMPDSIEAHNRQARAFQELGNKDLAEQAYARVLELDPYNAIAQKNLDKLKSGSNSGSTTISNELFLEEPGKTRSTEIVRPQTKNLSQYSSGEPLTLEDRKGQLALISTKGKVLGYLNPELSGHLIKLMALGNQYSAHLMTTGEHPHVFLRETKQSAAAARFVSFTRTSAKSGKLNSPKLRRSHSESAIDSNISDDDLDNWDSDDGQADSSLDDADDFNAVSLEQLRDEEDNSYPSRRNEY